MTDLSIIIVNYNTKKLTLDLLSQIFKSKTEAKFDVWVSDNASDDLSVVAIKRFYPQVNIIENKQNLGFSGGNNMAIKKVYKGATYIMLLNSDTKIKENTIDALYKISKLKNWDIFSCKLLNPDGSFQPNAGKLPSWLSVIVWLFGVDDIMRNIVKIPSYQQRSRSFYKDGVKVGWVSGSVMLIKSEVFDRIGFFDEKIFMYGEDVDFCMRAADKGFGAYWTNKTEIVHIGGASSKDIPKYNQWMGEFKGLIYLFSKNYSKKQASLLRVLIKLSTLLRTFAFFVIGKRDYAKNYAKIYRTI